MYHFEHTTMLLSTDPSRGHWRQFHKYDETLFRYSLPYIPRKTVFCDDNYEINVNI